MRWVVLGASITMGPSLAAIVLMITSGVGAQAMGTLGEEWTAQELRHLTRHGWHVVTGLTLRDWQIDHVAVGPSGVLVFETKWSAYPWAGTDADSFMRERRKVAVAQANQSRFHLASKLRHVLDKRDVHSVLVLWSAPGPVLERHEPEFVDGTTVLVVGDLASFVTRFEESHTQHIDTAHPLGDIGEKDVRRACILFGSIVCWLPNSSVSLFGSINMAAPNNLRSASGWSSQESRDLCTPRRGLRGAV